MVTFQFINDRFFTNPDDEWESAEIEFLLGDSFTHGACVNRPDDLSSVIRGLSNKNVITTWRNGPLTGNNTKRVFQTT